MSRPEVVVAAVIEREGRLLICRRGWHEAHPLKWEFPGGKVEAGESPRDALRRELEEELGVTAEIGEELARYEYRYPGRDPIVLAFYRVSLSRGEPQTGCFAEIRWERPERLHDYDLLEADREILSSLQLG